MPKYLFRLDDIAPNMEWVNYERVVDLFCSHEVYPLLGVIPDNHDPELLAYPDCMGSFWEEMRARRDEGWEIAQHGYRHQLDSPSGGVLRLHTSGEFAGHPEVVQLQRMRRGAEILEGEGLSSRIFMPPAHSFDEVTLACMRTLGFTMLTDGHFLFPYWERGILHVPQLFAHPRAAPFGVYTFCLHLNELTNEDFTRLDRFLEEHKEDVISFAEAARYARSPLSQIALKPLLSAALSVVRG